MAKQSAAGKAAMGELEGNGKALPEGFRKVNRARSGVWYRPEGATPLSGTLLGRFVGKKGAYYQIKVNADVTWKDKLKGMVKAGPGMIVNVPEKADLTCLNEVEAGVIVCLVALEKIDIGEGKTMWTFDVGVQAGTGEVE